MVGSRPGYSGPSLLCPVVLLQGMLWSNTEHMSLYEWNECWLCMWYGCCLHVIMSLTFLSELSEWCCACGIFGVYGMSKIIGSLDFFLPPACGPMASVIICFTLNLLERRFLWHKNLHPWYTLKIVLVTFKIVTSTHFFKHGYVE